MIISTPLDLPKIAPDSWEVFWKIWNQYACNLVKVRKNINLSKSPIGKNNAWKGFDIYKPLNLPTAWDAPFYDIKYDLPKLYQSILNLPFKYIHRVRIVSSLLSIGSHTDDNTDKWAVRAFLKHDDPDSQWYFTAPIPNDVNKQFLQMPSDTNWFAYNDKHCWHGTIFNPKYPKILVQLFMLSNPIDIVNTNIEKYPDYIIKL